MGTTMTVALVEDGQVSFGHVGDSRAYLIRDGAMEQLTEDHSLVAELMRSGKLSPEEAETHPQRSVITRALGTDPDVDVDTFTIAAQTGDVFLLCSDGLTTMVSNQSILDLVERHRGDMDKALRALVSAANKGGGEDNITVVAFEISAEALLHDGETREHVLEPAPVEDDEVTLTEVDSVPVVDTARDLHRRDPGRAAGEGARRSRRPAAPPATPDRRVARLAADRRRCCTRALPEVRPLTLSPRNRELAFLIVVGVLTAVGFASVYIARQDVVSTASLTYAGFFFALYIAAHLVTRYTVPFADPYLLPIAGLLTAIGLTEIYRLRPSDAFRQGIWIVVAVVLFAATLFSCSGTTAGSRRTSISSGSRRSRCCSCRSCR